MEKRGGRVIVDPDPALGVVHRRFIEGVGVTSKPNARPKR